MHVVCREEATGLDIDGSASRAALRPSISVACSASRLFRDRKEKGDEQENHPAPVPRRDRGRWGRGLPRQRHPGVWGRRGKPTIQPHLLGVQHFSVRDATARLGIASSHRLGLTPTMGHLGGPNYPEDPTDLGPLVPLPGGFAEVFEYLASVGVRGIRVLPVDAERQRVGPSAHRRRDPVISRQRRSRGAGDAPVRPSQPRCADREPDRRGSRRLADRSRREPVRLPADPRHEDDGLLGQPVQPEHTRRLGQPGHRRDHVRLRRPRPARRTGSARSSGIATFSTSSTRSRTTTATSTTRPTRRSARCTGSSG